MVVNPQEADRPHQRPGTRCPPGADKGQGPKNLESAEGGQAWQGAQGLNLARSGRLRARKPGQTVKKPGQKPRARKPGWRPRIGSRACQDSQEPGRGPETKETGQVQETYSKRSPGVPNRETAARSQWNSL